jgi:hypothetical protein
LTTGSILAGPGGATSWTETITARIGALRVQAEHINAAREHLEHVLSHHRDSPPDGCQHHESRLFQMLSDEQRDISQP